MSLHREELITRMRNFECSHKATLARSTYHDLLRVHEEIRSLIFYKMKQKLAWADRTMYEFSNKLGTMLARALRGPRMRTYISSIMAPSGQRLTTSSDMAVEFRSFYEGLYNLDGAPPAASPSDGRTTLPSYPRSLAVQEELEEHITIEELSVALAHSKPKKASGSDGLTKAYYKAFFETLSRPLYFSDPKGGERSTTPEH